MHCISLCKYTHVLCVCFLYLHFFIINSSLHTIWLLYIWFVSMCLCCIRHIVNTELLIYISKPGQLNYIHRNK